MKRTYKLSLIISLTLLINSSFSQDINSVGFSFQGYARNLEGAAMSSTSIAVKRSLYVPGNAVEFTEEETLTTDPFGVFQTVIGSVQTAAFKALNFNNKLYWMKIEVKPVGGTYATISDQALQSVPYAQAAENGVPVGTIIAFGGSTVPTGWLACDGASVSSSNYPKLFAAIGTSWGDGSTWGTGDFNLPDMRGLFLRGLDAGALRDQDRLARTAFKTGGASGDAVGSYQGSGIQSHAHLTDPPNTSVSVWDGSHNHQYNDPKVGQYTGFSPDGTGDAVEYITSNGGTTPVGGAHGHSASVDIAAFYSNTSGGNESRPVNVNVLYIVRAR